MFAPSTRLSPAPPVNLSVPAADPYQVSDRAPADVVVIGGGPTGAAAAASARAASGGSARVVLVDDDLRGPRPVAGRPVAALLREAAAAGLAWDAVRQASVGAAAARTRTSRPLDGVEVVLGRARLAGPGTVEVDLPGADAAGEPLRLPTRRVVLATGTVAALPDVTGLLDTRYVTPDTVLDLPDLPPSVVVVGAGRRGVALAQALARLGATVTLVESGSQLLPWLDADAAGVVETALRRDGVRLLAGSPVVTVAPTLDGGVWVGTEAGSDVAADLLVVATGRAADVAGLDLPPAGVALDTAGAVRVDERLRTSAPAVLAAGAVTGRRGDVSMARTAGSNAVARMRLARWTPAVRLTTVPTQPAVAVVGLTEEQAAGRSPGALVHELTGSAGLVRVVVTAGRDARLLGATIVTPGAGDAAAAAALVMSAGLSPDHLADLAEPGTALAAVAAALAVPSRPARPPMPSRPAELPG
jgi:mercuric reductase